MDSLYCTWFDTWKIKQGYKSNFEKSFFNIKNEIFHSSSNRQEKDSQDEVVSNIGETVFEKSETGVRATVWEAVHPSLNIFYRVFELQNLSQKSKHLRLFSNQNYRILESKIGETGVIDGNTLIHYKRDRYFLHGSEPDFDQYAVGTAEWKGLEGTWKDMERDAHLSGNPVSHGSIDSTLGWTLPEIKAGEAERVHTWIVFGKKYCNVLKSHKGIKESDKSSLFNINFNFWNSFTERISILPEFARMAYLPKEVRVCFYRSLLALVAHMDISGSVIASCDSDIKQFGADLYTYCWPRDAAWGCLALDRARYHHLSTETFEFFSKILTHRGNFLHKYTPAGDFGSTWHPVPMTQIDETGLPLYALYYNWKIAKNIWTVGRYYRTLIQPAADYLIKNLDETGLPTPSFDLWEERRGVHTYSACTVYAGLYGASELARTLGDYARAPTWAQAAGRVKQAVRDRLYDEKEQRFGRSLNDSTLDASSFAVWYFGILPPEEPRVVRTMQAIEKELIRPNGGVARYLHDRYYGYMNSWIICTLWLSQWHTACGNLQRALELLKWGAAQAHPTGLLPEQVNAEGKPWSVLPLAWSHSAYVLAVLEYLQALGKKRS